MLTSRLKNRFEVYTAILTAAVIIVWLVIVLDLFPSGLPFKTTPFLNTTQTRTTTVTQTNSSIIAGSQRDSIDLGNIMLCAVNCPLPDHYLEVAVFVNATSPLRSLTATINGVPVSSQAYIGNSTRPYELDYKASLSSGMLRIIPDRAYNVTFTATFENKNIFAVTKTTTALSR